MTPLLRPLSGCSAAALLLCFVASLSSSALAQTTDADQVAHAFGIDAGFAALQKAQKDGNDTDSRLLRLELKQAIDERVQAAELDVDSVISEIANEQTDLNIIKGELDHRLQRRKDHLNTAALLTGSALGAAVSATQFTSLSNSTQNTGDGIGIGSGVASTVLSILATRTPKNYTEPAGSIPNMLAPLIGDTPPALHTGYPPAILAYLNTVPAGEDASRGTRVEQLKQLWAASGRLEHIAALTASGSSAQLSMKEVQDRLSMLGDVRARVSLMKRSLAAALRKPADSRPIPESAVR